VEAALRALLTSYAPLTALVGTRIFWSSYPQGVTDPAVRLTKITGAPGYTLDGTDNLTDSIVQIDVRAVTVSDMWAVRDAIIAKLSGHRDSDFGGIFLTSERQRVDDSTDGLYHTAQLDFEVWHAA
jgi:hypothetical protein